MKLGHEPLVFCPENTEGVGDALCEGVLVRRFPYRLGWGETSFPYRHSTALWRVLPATLASFSPAQIWSCWPNFSIAIAGKIVIPYLHIPPSAHPVSFDGLLTSIRYQWKSPRILRMPHFGC